MAFERDLIKKKNAHLTEMIKANQEALKERCKIVNDLQRRKVEHEDKFKTDLHEKESQLNSLQQKYDTLNSDFLKYKRLQTNLEEKSKSSEDKSSRQISLLEIELKSMEEMKQKLSE